MLVSEIGFHAAVSC